MEEPDVIQGKWQEDNRIIEEDWGVHYVQLLGNKEIVNIMEEDPEKPLQVLEIGCEIGGTLFYIRENYPKAEIHGCDIAEGAVKIAAYNMDAFVSNIEGENLPFEPESLDVVVFGDVLEHLRDPQRTITYVKTLLKKGGCILASIPNLMHISVIADLLRGNFTYTDIGLLDRTHIHLFTYNEILRMFQSADFTVEQMTSFAPQLNAVEEKLITGLLALEPSAERFMYETFQYHVRARK